MHTRIHVQLYALVVTLCEGNVLKTSLSPLLRAIVEDENFQVSFLADRAVGEEQRARYVLCRTGRRWGERERERESALYLI